MPWEDVSPQEINDLKQRYSAIPNSGWQDVQQTGGPVQQYAQGINENIAESIDKVASTPARVLNLAHAGLQVAGGGPPGTDYQFPDIHPATWLNNKVYDLSYGGKLAPSDILSSIAKWAGHETVNLSMNPNKSSSLMQNIKSILGGGAVLGTADAGAGAIVGDAAAPYGGLALGLGAGAVNKLTRGDATQNLKSFDDTGIKGTAGQVTQNPLYKYLENGAAYIPGGRAAAVSNAKAQEQDLAKSANELLNPQGVVKTGVALKNGADNWVDATKRLFGMYDAKLASGFTPDDVYPTPNLAKFLAKEDYQPDGLQQSIKGVKDPEMGNMLDRYVKDLSEGNGNASIADLMHFRTLIGENISQGILQNRSDAAFRKAYGSLTEDIRAGIRQKDMQNAGANGLSPGERGPLEMQFDKQNDFWTQRNEMLGTYMKDIINQKSPKLVVDDLVNSHTNSANGRGGESDTLRNVMDTMKPPVRELYRDQIMSELGKTNANMRNPMVRDTSGNMVEQDWNFNTMLTNWNKMDSGAKDILLPQGTALRKRYDDLANIAFMRKEAGGPFVNSSQTTNTTQGAESVKGGINTLVGGLAKAAGVAGVGGAAYTAGVGPTAVALLAVPGVAYGITKGLSQNQNFISWLASGNTRNIQNNIIRLQKLMPSMSEQDRQDAQKVEAALVNQYSEQK